MTNQENLPLSTTLNANHLAFAADVRKVIGIIPNPAVKAKRGWIIGKHQCCAAVNRLFDESVKRCLEHPYSSKGPGSPPDTISESNRNLWTIGKN